MVATHAVAVLLLTHFLADFVAQSDIMAVSKSSSLYWLTLHCATYTLALLLAATVLLPPVEAVMFAYGNGVAHFATDFFTSKLMAYLHARSRHYFYVAIGADQLTHTLTLLYSYAWFQ